MRRTTILLVVALAATPGATEADDPPPADPEPAETSAPAAKAAPAAPAPPALAGKVSGRLVYTEKAAPEEKQNPRGGGGGLVGGVEGVAREIEAAGGAAGAAATVTATQELTIEAYLEERAGAPWRATLKVAEPVLEIPGGIQPSVRRALERESKLLVSELRGWSADLEPPQVLELKLQGRTSLDIAKPFASLTRWTGGPKQMVLHRTFAPQVIGMRYMIVGPHGLRPTERLPTASPVVVEVRFNRPPEAGEHLVELKAGGGVLKLVAQRVDDDPVRFMTPRFVVWFDDGGLPPEAPVLPSDRETLLESRP